MKIKLGIFFLLLAVLITAVVFKNKDRIAGGTPADTSENMSEKDSLTREKIAEFLLTDQWPNFAGKHEKMNAEALLKKKKVYVHLWASWCAPCLNEIPELIAYAKRNKATSQFILVSLDSSLEDLTKFLKSFPEMSDPLFIQIWDKDNKIAKKVDADRLPMTVILESNSNESKTIKAVVDWKSL